MKISKDAQAVIVRKVGDNVVYLLLKRFDKDKQEEHYRLVKGGVESNETSAQAAEREACEEVGITQLTNLGVIDSYQYTAGEVRHEVEVFLLEALDNKLSLDSSHEGGFTIKDAVWCEKDEAISKLNFPDEKKMIEKASVRFQSSIY